MDKGLILVVIIDFQRGGRGGGYKELDEDEIEETRRRRREAEEVRKRCSGERWVNNFH